MADSSTMNGAASSNGSMTAAQKLQEKHQATSNHNPEIEEVVDEDDIQHPPPSMHPGTHAVSSPDAHLDLQMKSDVAAGKRKEELPTPKAASKPLNTQSEEAFPSLRGGLQTSTAPSAATWGARKPGPAVNGTNGMNGHAATPSLTSSRATTPTSGAVTPSMLPSVPHQESRPQIGPQHVALPGRHKERIQFAPQQMLPRNQMKKPIAELLRSINKGSKANVEMRNGPAGHMVFEATGPVDAARQALKTLASQIGSTVSHFL